MPEISWSCIERQLQRSSGDQDGGYARPEQSCLSANPQTAYVGVTLPK